MRNSHQMLKNQGETSISTTSRRQMRQFQKQNRQSRQLKRLRLLKHHTGNQSHFTEMEERDYLRWRLIEYSSLLEADESIARSVTVSDRN